MGEFAFGAGSIGITSGEDHDVPLPASLRTRILPLESRSYKCWFQSWSTEAAIDTPIIGFSVERFGDGAAVSGPFGAAS